MIRETVTNPSTHDVNNVMHRHTSDRCWVLHPELKPKFTKDKRGGDHKRGFNHKANVAAQTTDSFFSNPMALLKDFTTYLQEKHGQESLNEAAGQDQDKPTALLSKFAGFLPDSNPENSQGIFTAFTTALEISNFHDLWVVDSNRSPLCSFISVQLLSVQQLTSTFKRDVLFTSTRFCSGPFFSSTNKHSLWHQRLAILPRTMCDICHYSKSTRLPFNLSLSKSSEMFELVHSDMWGPFLCLLMVLNTLEILSTLFHCRGSANIEQQSIAPTMTSKLKHLLKTTLPRRNPPRERHPPPNFAIILHLSVSSEKFLSYQNLSTSHLAYLTISSVHEPKNFHEANSQPMWRKSMDDELKALEETNTRNIFNLDGSIERPKSRVVAQGFTQHFGVDYKETFAPVAKMSIVKGFVICSANHGWSLSQMDVKNVFSSSMACQVKFYSEDLGFTRSSADSSLYVQIGQTEKLMVLIYVDDLIITGVMLILFYLLRDSNMLNSKPANTPFDSKLQLDKLGILLILQITIKSLLEAYLFNYH
ncbi:hypothetical protein AAG906_031067 [Vitis piasezkii]